MIYIKIITNFHKNVKSRSRAYKIYMLDEVRAVLGAEYLLNDGWKTPSQENNS